MGNVVEWIVDSTRDTSSDGNLSSDFESENDMRPPKAEKRKHGTKKHHKIKQKKFIDIEAISFNEMNNERNRREFSDIYDQQTTSDIMEQYSSKSELITNNSNDIISYFHDNIIGLS